MESGILERAQEEAKEATDALEGFKCTHEELIQEYESFKEGVMGQFKQEHDILVSDLNYEKALNENAQQDIESLTQQLQESTEECKRRQDALMQDESEKTRELTSTRAELEKSQIIQKEMTDQNDDLVQRVEEGQHHISIQQDQIKQLHEDLALTQELVAQSAAHSAGLQSQLDTAKDGLAQSNAEVESLRCVVADGASESTTLSEAMEQIRSQQDENQKLSAQVAELRLKLTTKRDVGSQDEVEINNLREENRSLVTQVAELRDTVSKNLNLSAKPESVALSEAKTRIVTQAAKIEQLKMVVKQLKLSHAQQKEVTLHAI